MARARRGTAGDYRHYAPCYPQPGGGISVDNTDPVKPVISADGVVAVTWNDTTPESLDNKINVVSPVTKTVINPSGNEKLQLNLAKSTKEIFKAYSPTEITITSGNDGVMKYQSVDSMATHSSNYNSSTGEYTVAVGGLYLIYVNQAVDADGDTSADMELRFYNGAVYTATGFRRASFWSGAGFMNLLSISQGTKVKVVVHAAYADLHTNDSSTVSYMFLWRIPNDTLW